MFETSDRMHVRSAELRGRHSRPSAGRDTTPLIQIDDYRKDRAMTSMTMAYSAPRMGSMSSAARPSRLRITRRGRRVLLALAAIPLVLAVVFAALNGGAAAGSLDAGVDLRTYTVGVGQSLWGIAEEIAPASDPRDVVLELARLNGLETFEVGIGQELRIPAKYGY